MIDVVIVNWNGWHFCRKLLTQLRTFVEHRSVAQVIVVDNSSTDGSPTAIAEQFPWVKLVLSPRNAGYGAGNNLGLQYATADYVWLLNNDIEIIDADVLKALSRELDDDPHCAAVAPALILPNGAYQTGAGGFELSARTAFNYFFFLSRFFPRMCRGFCLSQQAWRNSPHAVRVDWLCGAALLIRRESLTTVGGIPTESFMYAEDMRLCHRLRQIGCSVKYVPQTRVLHIHGGTEDSDGPKTRWLDAALMECSSIAGPLEVSTVRLIFAVGFFLRYLAYGFLAIGRRGSQNAVAAQRMWIFCQAALTAHPVHTGPDASRSEA